MADIYCMRSVNPYKTLCIWMVMACCFFCTQALAQTFQPYAVNYTVEHGVPSSECYSVAQDRKGIIWTGTDKGLCKYDGVRFSRLTVANGLPDNVVFGVFVDHKDRIWCRTFSKGLFYIDNGNVVIPRFNQALLRSVKSGLITNFCVTEQDSVFLEVSDYSLICAKTTEESIHIERPEERTMRFVGHSGFLYGGMNDKIRNRVRFKDDKSSFILRGSIHSEDALFRFARLGNNDILFNNKEVLYLKRSGSDRVEKIHQFTNWIIAIYRDRDGGVWIGTVNNGIYYYENSLQETPRHYFEQESVSSIVQDAEGNIWFTTLKSGLYFIVNKNVLSIGSSKQPFSLVSRIDSTYIACSSIGDIFSLGGSTVKRAIKGPAGSHSFNHIHNYDPNTWLFMGVGSFLMDKRTLKSKGYFAKRHYYKGACNSRNGKYLYLFNHGIIRRADKLTKRITDSVLYPGGRIMDIGIDDAENIWMATLSGLVVYNPKKKEFISTGTGAMRTRINSLKLLPGKIILTTDNEGVLIYDIGKQTYRQVSEKDGMSSNNCQNVYVDGRDIWVATNKGISVIRTGQHFGQVLAVQKIDLNDGLPGQEINKILIDGAFVWATSNSGLIWFKKSMAKENRLPPQIYLDQVRSNKKTYSALEKGLVLPDDENYLEFHFYGISYKSLKSLKYKYRLKGAGEAWNYTYQSAITYPALSPGKYVFELYALNNDGVQSLRPVVFAFEIMPPFWLSWPFLVLEVLIMAGIVFHIFYYRLRSVKKRERERNFYHNKILEFELRALRAQMNPHFIFNAVASIQNYIIINDRKSANKYLVKFSKLIRGVLDNSNSSLIPLSKELNTLRLYIDIENLRFLNRINYTITVDDQVEADRFMIPPMLIQPFVENAIWHGLLPKKDNCELSITINIRDEKLECRIRDNGVGRHAASLRPLRTPKKRSLGLEMTRSRIIALEKIYKMKLNIEIFDQTDEWQQPAGTEVVITLPIIT